MSKKRILVSGADGFIGSHLTELLVREGHEVRAFCYYNSFGSLGWLDKIDPETKSGFEPVLGDVRDTGSVRAAVKGCDIVLHLAALIGIPYSYQAPQSYIDTNITGTLNMLQAALDFDVDHMVQTSTSETYGTARFVPITEDHPLVGQSPYSASKIGADQMALSFHRSFDLSVTIIRPFNTYGPRQSARAVIPTIITQALEGANTLMLGSLHPTRDFNYVADIARGFMLAGLSGKGAGEAINLASNFEISIGQLVETVGNIVGRTFEVETEDTRIRPDASEVERLWGDNTRARDILGWAPEYGGLEGFGRGILETVEWFSDPANRASYKPDQYAV